MAHGIGWSMGTKYHCTLPKWRWRITSGRGITCIMYIQWATLQNSAGLLCKSGQDWSEAHIHIPGLMMENLPLWLRSTTVDPCLLPPPSPPWRMAPPSITRSSDGQSSLNSWWQINTERSMQEDKVFIHLLHGQQQNLQSSYTLLWKRHLQHINPWMKTVGWRIYQLNIGKGGNPLTEKRVWGNCKLNASTSHNGYSHLNRESALRVADIGTSEGNGRPTLCHQLLYKAVFRYP